MLGWKMRAGLALGLVVAAFAACTPRRPVAPAAPPLRVLVPSDAPPYAFQRGSQAVGLEVDFARELGTALGRPLELRSIGFEELIPTLLAGRADLAMAGLTITPARQVRMAFSDPYLRSGLIAIMRREDVNRYTTPESVLQSTGAIGVVTGTTGDRFVRERAPLASVLVYPTVGSAVDELKQRRIDFLVHDAPVGLWFVSMDEANLAPLLKLLNEEHLAWGMRRDDEALRGAVNGVLARWRADGTRDRILNRWLPYWPRLEREAPAR